ncbi:unnamed protein product [Toxocara canis]|uniref:Kinesin motor domain-containing protein n=1 Tax=Toxocara canis TaxID=6265 RepID=A0A183UWK8_TOXCA|nr:unnamed protein product [Toxocara canis]
MRSPRRDAHVADVNFASRSLQLMRFLSNVVLNIDEPVSRPYSMLASVARTDVSVLQGKGKRCAFVGVPHKTTKDSTARTDYVMTSEAVKASENHHDLDAPRPTDFQTAAAHLDALALAFSSRHPHDSFLNFVAKSFTGCRISQCTSLHDPPNSARRSESEELTKVKLSESHVP